MCGGTANWEGTAEGSWGGGAEGHPEIPPTGGDKKLKEIVYGKNSYTTGKVEEGSPRKAVVAAGRHVTVPVVGRNQPITI